MSRLTVNPAGTRDWASMAVGSGRPWAQGTSTTDADHLCQRTVNVRGRRSRGTPGPVTARTTYPRPWMPPPRIFRLADQLRLGMLRFDADHVVQEANEAAHVLLGKRTGP